MATTFTERPIPTGEGLTFEKVWAMFQESDRRFEETREQMRETDRYIKNLNKQMGGLHNSFGEMEEHLVAPGITKRFNKMGFKFYKMNPRQKIFDENGMEIAEVDLVLENGNCIMAVEIKSSPKEKHILHHIKRLEILREDMDKHKDTRKIYGAVAGAVFGTAEKTMSIEAGFYVLEQTGDTLRVANPDGFVPKEW